MLLTVSVLNVNAQGPYPSSTTPQSVCLNSTEPYGVNLTAGSTYAWTISDPTAGTITNGATTNLITVEWKKAGNYTLQVVETNQYSCVGTPVSIVVNVNPIAIISNKATTICSGETFTVTPVEGAATDVIPAGTTYSWNAPAAIAGISGLTSGSGAANISGTLTNTTSAPVDVVYTVTATSGSCTSTFTVTVKVYPQVNTSPIYHN